MVLPIIIFVTILVLAVYVCTKTYLLGFVKDEGAF